jgi:hypothetical protein
MLGSNWERPLPIGRLRLHGSVTGAWSGGVTTGALSPRRCLTGSWRPHLGSDGPAKWRRTSSDDDERRRTDSVGEEGR